MTANPAVKAKAPRFPLFRKSSQLGEG